MVEAEPPPPELPANIGRYRIVSLLGEGSMGRVLLAHDPVLDREVAVKHLRSDLSIPDEVRRGLVVRMRHEARAAARVMHPHLVTLHDMGEDERVGLYLVFEYVAGPTLKARVAEGRLLPKDAARVALELGSAMTTAHEAGILHRDIKPENVILSKKGAKLADFGIAKIPDSTLTHQGGLMGTPAYSAPETFRTSTFSPESDQFSLAATLYEAVSGKRAFPGDDAVAVAQRILHESAEPMAAALQLTGEVDLVFAKALSRKPRDRFASCEVFGRALADALAAPAGSPGAAPAAGGGAAGPTAALTGVTGAGVASVFPRERRSSHIALGVVAVLVTGSLLVRTALKNEEAAPPAPPPSASATAPPLASSAARPRVSAVRPVPRPPASLSASAPPPSVAVDAGTTAPSESASASVSPPPSESATATASASAPRDAGP